MIELTAHVDTFARDRLPPREQWPRLQFDRPELHYPAHATAHGCCSTMASRRAMASSLARDLQDFATTRLAPYKYPRAVEFVDELPKTATGKVQRYALRHRQQSTTATGGD